MVNAIREASLYIYEEITKEWTKNGVIVAALFLFAVNIGQGIDRFHAHKTIVEQRVSIAEQRVSLDSYEDLFQSTQDEAHELLAITQHLQRRNSHVPSVVAESWATTIQQASQIYNLNVSVMLSLYRVESATMHYSTEGFITVSHKGAGGLGQIMPFWARECPHAKSRRDLANANVNILCSAFILRHYMGEVAQTVGVTVPAQNQYLALVAYNGGMTSVRALLRGRNVTKTYARDILRI